MDKIIEQAISIGEDKARGWDEAALFLGPYRRELATSDLSDNANLTALTSIVSTQLECLRKAGKADTGIQVGEWFHHVLHDLPTPHDTTPRDSLREPLAHFFCEYARCLCVEERFEEMRLAMRTALDTTRMLPMMIVMLVHLYAPLARKPVIEGEASSVWLSKRYCECLALLDFSGYGQTPFRATLDDFQAALRFESEREALYQTVRQRNDAKDPALDTLTRLFEKYVLSPTA